MTEFDLPKGRERLEDYWKFQNERMTPLLEKLDKEKLYDGVAFGDNTGHVVWLVWFEDTEAFSKHWNNQEFQRTMSGFAQMVDNLNYRLGRPVIYPD
jgi:hypothetical protein